MLPLLHREVKAFVSNMRWLSAGEAKSPGLWQNLREGGWSADGTRRLLSTLGCPQRSKRSKPKLIIIQNYIPS